jgi:hypothetical protein
MPAQKEFLDTFICQANQAGIGYFFFEVSAESGTVAPPINVNPPGI